MRKIMLLFIMFLIISCDNSDTGVKDNITEYEEILLEDEILLNSELIVSADPRIEILSVIQHFTTWANKRHTIYESRYKVEIDKYFSRFSDHNAIKVSQELTNYGFSYDAPPNFVLYHSNPPEFELVTDYTDHLIARAGSRSKLENFATEIRKFAIDTDFMTFFRDQKAYYRKIENDIKRTIGNLDFISILENYYGTEQISYNVIPASLFHHGGYGASIATIDGNSIYNICGPASSNKGLPSFGDENYFQYILLHEFSHSFVNPLTEKYRNDVNKYSQLFDPIKSVMANMAYPRWETCVNEHLVRVNVARFTNQMYDADYKDSILQKEYDRGFIYINGLDSVMNFYELNRNTYSSYAAYYPEILKYFKSVND